MNNKNIKYKIAYFKKVIENMDNKVISKSIDIEDHEKLTDQIEELCYSIDEYFCGNLLDWIELVENADLYKALKSLSVEEQTLLSYVYYKDKTQKQVAKLLGMSQQKISYKLYKTLHKIKNYFM